MSQHDSLSTSKTNSQSLLSIIIPVYNEAKCIPILIDRLTALGHRLPHYQLEMIFINDGSKDDTYTILNTAAQTNPHIKVLHFSRNFGHQMAVTAGLDYANGDAIVVIDADLQDPPEVIPDLIAEFENGYDIVYAKRKKRQGDSLFKRATASLFYRLLNSLSDTPIEIDTGDFRLMSHAAVRALNTLRENDRFIRGMVNWLGFKTTTILYDRAPRYAGTTAYPLAKMIRFALNGIISFSNAPLRVATWLGLITSGCAVLYTIRIIIFKFLGDTVPGYASIMATLLLMGGVQLVTIGILGEYIGRLYIQTKQRPLYILQEAHNISSKSIRQAVTIPS